MRRNINCYLNVFALVALLLFLFLNVFEDEGYSLQGEQDDINSVETEDSVLFSLISLKKSSDKISESNKALALDNEEIKNKLNALKMELMYLGKEVDLEENGNNKDFSEEKAKEIELVNKGLESIKKDIVQLENENQSIKGRIEAKNMQITDLQKEVSGYNSDISRLDQTSKIMSLKTKEEMNIKVRNNLLEKIKISGNNIERKEKELRKNKQKFKKPLKTIKDLNEQQAMLKQSLIDLENEYKKYLDDKEKVIDEVKQVESMNERRLLTLKEEISKLKERNAYLNDVLSKADNKLKSDNIRLKNEFKDDSLRENLSVIKEENTELKKKFVSLREQIRNLQDQ